MSAILDPDKLSRLRVDELRAALTSRGLDSSGVKPFLVDRLRSVLLAEREAKEMELQPVEQNSAANELERSALPLTIDTSGPQLTQSRQSPHESIFKAQERILSVIDKGFHDNVPVVSATESEVVDRCPDSPEDFEGFDDVEILFESIPHGALLTDIKTEPLSPKTSDAEPVTFATDDRDESDCAEPQVLIPLFPLEPSTTTLPGLTENFAPIVPEDQQLEESQATIIYPGDVQASIRRSMVDYDETSQQVLLNAGHNVERPVQCEIIEVRSPPVSTTPIAPSYDNSDVIADFYRELASENDTPVIISAQHEILDKKPVIENLQQDKTDRSGGRRRNRDRNERKQKRRHSPDSLSQDAIIGTEEPDIVDVIADDESQEQEKSDKKKTVEDPVVCFDVYTSDLNLKVNVSTRTIVEPFIQEGFALMWAGARATYGLQKGKAAFEVKIVEHLDVHHISSEEHIPHLVRVGWSMQNSGLQLGETNFSFGYDGSGKICSNNGCFENYGEPFAAGDIITALIDFDERQISFMKNGIFCGKAFDFYSPFKEEAFDENSQRTFPFPIFPHVLVKNCRVEANFGSKDPWFPPPEGYTMINLIPEVDRVRAVKSIAEKKDCTFLMMVGLPGAGKTTWVERFVREHPAQCWYVLSMTAVLERMKVQGQPRRKVWQGRWDFLIGMATKCLNKLLIVASRRRRNYILDQTNVYLAPRKRKVAPFKEFRCKAVVIVPNEADFAYRCRKQALEEGKTIPPEAVLEMKANFSIPDMSEGSFDEIEWVEMKHEEAEGLVAQYNEEGRAYKAPERKNRRGSPPPPERNLKDDRPSMRGIRPEGPRGLPPGWRGPPPGPGPGWGGPPPGAGPRPYGPAPVRSGPMGPGMGPMGAGPGPMVGPGPGPWGPPQGHFNGNFGPPPNFGDVPYHGPGSYGPPQFHQQQMQMWGPPGPPLSNFNAYPPQLGPPQWTGGYYGY